MNHESILWPFYFIAWNVDRGHSGLLILVLAWLIELSFEGPFGLPTGSCARGLATFAPTLCLLLPPVPFKLSSLRKTR